MKHLKTIEDFTIISENEMILVESTDAMLKAAITNLKNQSISMLQNFKKRLDSGKTTNWNEEQIKKLKSAVNRNLKKRQGVKESEETLNESKVTNSPAYKELTRHLKDAVRSAHELSNDEEVDVDGPSGIGKDVYAKLVDVWRALGFYEDDLIEYLHK